MRILLFIAALVAATSIYADQDFKANTAANIVLGPFVDSTNAISPETALTLSQADIRISKNGGTWSQKNDATSCTHMENGFYSCPLDATDLNTMGNLAVAVFETGAVPVVQEFNVLSEVAYIEKYESDSAKVYGAVIASPSPTTSAFGTGLTEASNDHYNGAIIVFLTGNLKGQRTSISDYDGTTKVITVSPALTEAPASTDLFVLY